MDEMWDSPHYLRMKNVICKTEQKTKYLSSDLNIQIYYFIDPLF
jgi:hypothetical protein